jgi:DNA repair protein SbcD/Mre11
MRILHTSDWHLGKLFHEKSLIEDQAFMLDQILETIKGATAEGRPFSALIVAGDIYDRALPPSEAGTLLNDFLERATGENPGLHIFLNAGNHDSATRLSFAAGFLKKHNIHICTDTKNFTDAVLIEENGEKVAFYQLPFLTPYSIEDDGAGAERAEDGEEKSLRSQEELYSVACKKIIEAHKKNYGEGVPAVLNAHLFAAGAAVAASERTNVGAVEQADISHFKDFTYCAFGHIHKFQPCDKEKRCFYSGSLLPYNFDDSPECGVLDVEIKNPRDVPAVKRILLKPLHPIANLTGPMKDFIGSEAKKSLIQENQNNYVQVILTDAVMPSEAFITLKSVFPNLLCVTMKEENLGGKNVSIQSRKEAIDSNDPEKIFCQFMKDLYGDVFDDGEPGAGENHLGGGTFDRGLFQAQKKIFLKEAGEL